jgi:hypothetical protein
VLSDLYSIDGSDSVFLLRPLKLLEYNYVSKMSHLDIATPHIGYRIGAATTEAGLRGAHSIYRFLLGQPETRTSARWIFEARMHRLFQCGGRFGATQLGGSQAITVEMAARPYRTFAELSELGSLLRKPRVWPNINPDIVGVYFRPQQPNPCSLDFFVITKPPTSDKLVLVLFHFTTSTAHRVKAHWLASIWAEMPATLKRTPPILVFVVPDDIAMKFPRQTITLSDSNNSGVVQEWDQYVFPVSSKTLWETPTHDCEESAVEPAATSARENHVLRPRSHMPLRDARLGAKRKASPVEADNEAEEVGEEDEDAPPAEGKATKARKLANPASHRSARAK